MSWAEVIRLRVPATMEDKVTVEVAAILADLAVGRGGPGDERPRARLYRSPLKTGDLAVVLLWPGWVKQRSNSDLALGLASVLRQYGLVNSSQWLESRLAGA